MSKRKYSKEFKLKVLKEHEEEGSFYCLEKKYGITLGSVKRWNSVKIISPISRINLAGTDLKRGKGLLFQVRFQTMMKYTRIP